MNIEQKWPSFYFGKSFDQFVGLFDVRHNKPWSNPGYLAAFDIDLV